MCWLASEAATLFLLFLFGFGQPDNNFGPYRLNWQAYDLCKGPKQKECGLVEIQQKQNMSNIIFALDFPKDCHITTARVTVATKNNNVSKKVLNYPINNPCEHFVLGPIIMDSFNLSSSCKIKKGIYTVHLNMDQKASAFLGKSFFYGQYFFKVVANNKNENFFCVQTSLLTEKA